MFADALLRCLGDTSRLSGDQVRRLEQHHGMLVRWNKVLNLTSIRTLEEAIERHYGESVFLAAHLPAGVLSIADVGSGAGFPGIPIAVVRPDCRVTLIEAHRRKAVFLREAARDLPNVTVIADRAESVHQSFDIAVSRAVKLESLLSILPGLASKIMLLAGQNDKEAVRGVLWDAPIPLPWGARRFLRIGHVLPNVPRETRST